jgi:hypothetical protein
MSPDHLSEPCNGSSLDLGVDRGLNRKLTGRSFVAGSNPGSSSIPDAPMLRQGFLRSFCALEDVEHLAGDVTLEAALCLVFVFRRRCAPDLVAASLLAAQAYDQDDLQGEPTSC